MNMSRVAADAGATPEIHFCHQGVAVSDSVTAAGAEAPRNALFAAGHLGELTWQVPFRAGRRGVGRHEDPQRRLRDLPSRVGVYFVLALCLFPGLGYRKVWAKLTATTRSRKPPSDKALRDLRRRLGAAPLKALFEVLAGPVAAPHCRGAVRALPHCRVRRVCVVQGRRHRPQPILVGQAQGLPWCHRLSGGEADDRGRDRHPSIARRCLRAAVHR
jgi:hypothetical protein